MTEPSNNNTLNRPLHSQFAPLVNEWEFSRFSTMEPDAAAEAVESLSNRILEDAVRARATDVHFDPTAHEVALRFRVDGRLHDVKLFEKDLGQRLIGHFKALARIDPIPLTHPADGRAVLAAAGHDLNLRVACVPTIAGEKLAMRLLDLEKVVLRLSDLGMHESQQEAVEEWLREISGMLLVVGATGSGKTTTLYSILHELKLLNYNLVTVEDPVEYRIDGITQMQVSERPHFPFSEGVRAMLRLDPDFMLIGEMRDSESAAAAVDAASSGKTVLSTLHSRDTAGALTSLRTLDLDDHEIAPALELVIAQRLVRKLCPECRRQDAPKPFEEDWIRSTGSEVPDQVWHAVGCDACSHTGYQGRTGIFEVWRVTDDFKRLILEHSDERELRKALRDRQIGPLVREGIQKAVDGVTSIEDLIRGAVRQ